MASTKLFRQQIYSTPLDFRLLTADVVTALTNADTINIDDYRADSYALRAKGIIDTMLGGVVSGVSSFETTPYAGPPIKKKADYDETTTSENTGTGNLWGMTVNSTAYTEKWTITFTSATAYDLVGSYSGTQGSGDTSADFDATDSDISIPAAAWSGAHASGDIFYISSYKHIAPIVTISTMLAVSLYFKGSASGVRGAEEVGIGLYDDAIKLLKMAIDNDGFVGSDYSVDASDLQIPWHITLGGYDATAYKEDEVQNYPCSWYARDIGYNL